MMKRNWSTYAFIILLITATSAFLTCQCGDDVREHAARVASESHDCCNPVEREAASAHSEKECCGQCFSSSTIAAYVHRATFTLSAVDVLDVYAVVSQSEQNEPHQCHATVHEEGGSFFIAHVFTTVYSSQAPPLA